MLKLVLFVTVLTAISTVAEASALPQPAKNLLQSELKRHASPRAARDVRTAHGCADFSGAWEGTCRIKDQEQKGAFTITQKGCSAIEIEGDKIEMGHNKIESDSSLFATANAQVNTRFSQDGQTAKALATILVDSPFFPDAVSGRLGGEMRKQGEDLLVNGKIDLWLGMKDLVSLPVDCSFQKKN